MIKNEIEKKIKKDTNLITHNKKNTNNTVHIYIEIYIKVLKTLNIYKVKKFHYLTEQI